MRNALILGANSDIGKALARVLAANNHHLALAARDTARLASTASDLTIRHRADAATVEFDALDCDSHPEFYDGLAERPDIVVCIFGYLGHQTTAQSEFHEARKIIDTNFTGAVSILNIVADDFEKRGSGTIVGISSVAGDRGRGSNYIYGSAKAGFSAYLSGLRNRLAPAGAHVVTVKPGFVRTKMTAGMDLPFLLTADPERVARDIYRACRNGRNVVYTKWLWRYIMIAVRCIPESIFKRLRL